MTDQRVKRPIPWGPILGVWTMYWLLLSAQLHISTSLQFTLAMPWPNALLLQFPFAYCWALATPVILALGRRFPIRRGQLALSVPVHLVFCCVLVFALE